MDLVLDLTIDLLSPDIKKLEDQEQQLVRALELIRRAKLLFGGATESAPAQRSYSEISLLPLEGGNTYLDSIKEILRTTNKPLKSGEIIQIVFDKYNRHKITDFNKLRQNVFPVFTRAYKTGDLLKDADGYITIGK